MSMLSITGEVINIFTKPATERDGQAVSEKPQVQIMGKVVLPNGSERLELVTLSTEDPALFTPFKSKIVIVPIGVFSPSKGSIIYYIPRGSKPRAA